MFSLSVREQTLSTVLTVMAFGSFITRNKLKRKARDQTYNKNYISNENFIGFYAMI